MQSQELSQEETERRVAVAKSAARGLIGIALLAGIACLGYKAYKHRLFDKLADRRFWESASLLAWHPKERRKELSFAQKCASKFHALRDRRAA